MIRLAVVDDSAFVRKALYRVFDGSESIQVVGLASSGEELLANLAGWQPDLVTLDLNMPGIGGLPTLDRILEWRRIPVIILSTHSAKDAPLTIEALHRGAVDFIDKQAISLVDFSALRGLLVEKIALIADRGQLARPVRKPKAAVPPPAIDAAPSSLSVDFAGIAIGASTGGPPAIQQVLEEIGAPPSVPIVIVQHMPVGFTRAFADRLNSHLRIAVREAVHGEILARGTAYIAPAGLHLKIRREADRVQAVLANYPDDVSHRPSVDVLFDSVASVWGSATIAVLLTGMGRDGAEGLAKLRAGGAWTIAQDEATSTVYGMPKAAQELGAAIESLPLGMVGHRISTLLTEGRPRRSG